MDSRQQAKVVVVGSYNVGLNVNIERLPVWGETILGSGFDEVPGGKGSNQAVAAARLGASVSFVGCVGNDHYGDTGVEMLQSEGVDISHLRRVEGEKTGVGIVYVRSNGDNCIVVDSGANLSLTSDDVEKSATIIENADILLVQLENSPEATVRAMQLARAVQKPVILNPAPARTEVNDFLKNCTILTPNETELKILASVSPEVQLNEQEYAEVARQLLVRGPQVVVVTLGENGALIVDKDTTTAVRAPSVTPVDTTGAGDCFNGALAVALAQRIPLTAAVEFACRAASFSVTKPQVIPSLPYLQDLA